MRAAGLKIQKVVDEVLATDLTLVGLVDQLVMRLEALRTQEEMPYVEPTGDVIIESADSVEVHQAPRQGHMTNSGTWEES